MNDEKECLINDYVVILQIMKLDCYRKYINPEKECFINNMKLNSEQEIIIDIIVNRNKIRVPAEMKKNQ